MADPVGLERLDDLGDLRDAELAALLADVDRHAEPAALREADVLADLGVVVPCAVRPRPGDVDTDDAPRGVAQRLLDDHEVLLGA